MEKEKALFLSAGTLNSRTDGADTVNILWLWCSLLGFGGALGTLHGGAEPFMWSGRGQRAQAWPPCGHNPVRLWASNKCP